MEAFKGNPNGIYAYRSVCKCLQQQWNYCEQAIQGLIGKWAGELDSFYTDLLQRVVHFKQNPPAEDWDHVRVKELQVD